jgi:toxin ParE1/3/4
LARVFKSAEARIDACEIWSYIGNDNPNAADSITDLLEEKLVMLAESPGVGTKRDELSEGLRSFAVRPFILFYRSAPGGIELVRILHGSRDLPKEFHA